jgi:hypothetical protein
LYDLDAPVQARVIWLTEEGVLNDVEKALLDDDQPPPPPGDVSAIAGCILVLKLS